MNEQSLKTIALKLSEALLLYKGEISIEGLKGLPFIDEEEAYLIAHYLRNKFNLKVSARRLKNEKWDDVLSLY
jgi:hypothetical protein